MIVSYKHMNNPNYKVTTKTSQQAYKISGQNSKKRKKIYIYIATNGKRDINITIYSSI